MGKIGGDGSSGCESDVGSGAGGGGSVGGSDSGEGGGLALQRRALNWSGLCVHLGWSTWCLKQKKER